MSLGKARNVFTSYSTERAIEVANRYGISIYLANFAWQRWGRELEALPEGYQNDVYAACQRSWKGALTRFVHNPSELRWICRHWRLMQGMRPAEMKIGEDDLAKRHAEALSIFRLFAPVGSLTDSLYDDACLYIDKALVSARSQKFRVGHYRGELSVRELARARRSDFAWVFEMLGSMDCLQVFKCFGQHGVDFVAACRWTFACRRSRRDKHVLDIRAGNTQDKMIASGGSGRQRYEYLPRPEASPGELAHVVDEHFPGLLAA